MNNINDYLIEKLNKSMTDPPNVLQENSSDTEDNFTEIDDNYFDNTLGWTNII